MTEKNKTEINNDWDNDVIDHLEEEEKSHISLLKLDEILLDGETGEWSIKHLTKSKIKTEDGKEKYPVTPIQGSSIEVIIIKKGLKKSSKKGDMGKVLSQTGEYINKEKPAYYFNYENGNKKSTIIPADILGQGTGFKNSQIMYVLYEKNLYRLILNGKKVAREDGIHNDQNNFFGYIWSFDKDNKSYKVSTKIEAVKMKNPTNPKKIIYTCLFSKVGVIEKDNKNIPLILNCINIVGDNLKKYFESIPQSNTIVEDMSDEEMVENIEQDTTEDNENNDPEKIPF